MYNVVVYQTLDNRDNADEVEQHGPYKCMRSNAWLGEGYYFWEYFIELAHLWGNKVYNNNYFICKSECTCIDNDVLDLVGNTNNISDLKACHNLLSKTYKKENLTILFLLEYLKEKTNFSYKAIRAYPIDSLNTSEHVKFVKNKKAYIDLCPPIQLCVIDKNILKGFEIVYPNEYCNGYLV